MIRRIPVLVVFVAAAALGVSGQGSIPPSNSRAPTYGYTVVKSYPHDPKAYTQGLEFSGGVLFEGTGLKGQSAVRKVDLETGKVVQEEKIHPQYFGEGVTVAAGKLFQVTWKDRAGFVYDAKTLKLVRNFTYFGEGWGLTHDPAGLIMSDGSSTLRFMELTRFQERRKLKVMDSGTAIVNLNELEMIKGEIWANVWQTDYIVRISPKDGQVLGWINLKGLLSPPYKAVGQDAVLNGIAYDSAGDRIFVTGKLWPRLYEIKVK
ncbi:MAG: glutaminyl-peptide cyclotransferase [Vicinamibacterales bacterium]|nr:glutaminyl-peptide cyclotransferase [Vicinamibacterales bacterium]